MPPVVSIVGKSKSGKTTLLEKLIKELKSRGYRVATIKHTHHQITFDEPGKDSWRHLQAGSEAAMLCTDDNAFLIRPGGYSLEQLVPLFGEDYDIILTEGFSHEGAPKIEVRRKEAGPPLPSPTNVIAVAGDEPSDSGVQQFSLEDAKSIADFLEKEFIRPGKEKVSLYVNEEAIPLTEFPRQVVSNILLALASSLKGVRKIKNLALFYRKS
ncbi:MAG: molybdopterin-guanine dinucleotide biosynthesis protein B [Dehalococcoidia bacterium]|jgi:molybdopterin-guanine dinucleotide biosynthesis protein B